MAANSQDLEDKHSDKKQTVLRGKNIVNEKNVKGRRKVADANTQTVQGSSVVQPLPSQTNTLTCTLARNRIRQGITVTLR